MKPAYKIVSPETGTEYWVLIEAPDQAKSPGPWPILIFLDGDNQFDAGVAAYHKLGAADEAPPLLLVGLGYGAGYGKAANKRGRDYTPTRHGDEPSSGGAAAFLNFLTQTFWPDLARRFPVSAAGRGIAGHSLSSLFVLYALFQAKPFFGRYLASAPSIWWDNRSVLRLAEKLRTDQSRLPARLFLSAGAEDSVSMIGDLALLESQLARQPFSGLEIVTQRFPGLNHYDVLPAAFSAGIKSLYGRESFNSASPKPDRRPPRPRQSASSPRGSRGR